MPLPLSGPLTLAQIQAEFGGTNPIGLNEYYRGGIFVSSGIPQNANVPTSGTISLSNFYGAQKAFTFTLTIASNTTNYNLSTSMTAAGWNGTDPVVATVTINSGVSVLSNNTATPAFTVPSLPTGSAVSIINNGTIAGLRGLGGRWGSSGANSAGKPGGVALQIASPVTLTNNNIISGGGAGGGLGGDVIANFCQGTNGANGGAGGAAISMTANLIVTNNGTIAGGGGGGAGGASYKSGDANGSFSAGGGGGGGGQGFSGGDRARGTEDSIFAGCSFGFTSDPTRSGFAGTDGSYSAPGVAGTRGFNQTLGQFAGFGGSGGAFGSAGGNGTGAGDSFPLAGGTGGAGGAGILKPSGTLTLLVTGTIFGAY
jgi:hypothetical protein